MTKADALIGQHIGSYKIISHLARGGMADVYLADDLGLRRQVVLKIMLPELAQNEEFVMRFQREARTTARLNHPNIIQVYSTGLTQDGRPYLAMQYIRGGTLHENLLYLVGQQQRLAVDKALSLTRQVAEALNVAHNAGIVHRDLKPSNILLHTNGTPVVTDLGIAAVESTMRLTRTGEVMGTPFYMSPEQAQGKPLDGRSDIYSLGVILYEILAGTPPFRATSPLAVLHQHIYEPPPPLTSRGRELAPITRQIVDICLRKDPEQRFQSAGQLVTALDQAIATETGMPTAAGSAALAATILEPANHQSQLTSPYRQPQYEATRSWRWLLLLPLGAILIALFIFGGQRLFSNNADLPATPVNDAVASQIPTDVSAEPGGAVNEPTAPVEDILSSTGEPTAEIVDPTITPAPATATLTEIPPLPPRRNQIVFQSNRDGDHEIYIMDRDGSGQQQLTSNSAADNYPVVSPDGQLILFQSERDGDREIYVMGIDGSDPQRLTHSAGNDSLPTWSPDGSKITFLSDRNGNRDLYIMDADGSNPRQVTFDALRKGHPSWSVNDQLVFNAGTMAGNTWEIYTIDTDGSNLQQLTHNNVSDWSAEWSPDGEWILYLSSISKADEAAIFMMNADGSNSHLVFTSDDYEWGADWTPDGTQIVFTRESGDYSYIYLMDASGSNVTYITERGSYPSWVP